MLVGSAGRSLELFFIDGNPDGMQTAEVFNWTGHVLMTPRTRIKDALERREAKYTGVYLLIGEIDGKSSAYIGEGENISERIRNHDQNKDWWTQAVLITTGANNLNKAHVKYLEARLVEIARSIRRRELENSNTPPRSSLSEAAQSNMESFLSYILMILPALRIDMFQEYVKPVEQSKLTPQTTDTDSPIFELIFKKDSLNANAKLMGDDFVVLEGSTARMTWVGSGTEESGYAQLHRHLREIEVLTEQSGHCVFQKNYAFRSPSAAAAVILGRNANGPTEWKIHGGKTYKEWEAGLLKTSEDDLL